MIRHRHLGRMIFLPFLSISLRARRGTIFSKCIITIFFHKMRNFPLLYSLKLSHGNLIQYRSEQPIIFTTGSPSCIVAVTDLQLVFGIVLISPAWRSVEDWCYWWQCRGYRSLFTLGSTHYHHQPPHYYYTILPSGKNQHFILESLAWCGYHTNN